MNIEIPIIDRIRTVMKVEIGNSKLRGRSVNNPLYMVIMNPSRLPMNIPMKLLLNTNTNASYQYTDYIKFIVTPNARYIAISLVYS